MFFKINSLKFLGFISAIFIAVNLLTSYLAHFFLPQGSFPYREMLDSYQLPAFITPFANFDGAHYIRIAKLGYGGWGVYEQAFFPLYPFLINLVSFLVDKNYLIAGFLTSHLFFFLGVFFFWKYLNLIIAKPKKIFWIFIFLLTFPSSFFFQAVYTESLFFFLVVVSLYLIQKREYKLAAFFCFLSSLSRLAGIFLTIPFLISILERQNFRLLDSLKKNWRLILLSSSPFFGLLIYSLFLYLNFGDPLLFYHAQVAFGANRSASSVIFLPQIFFRYFRIFWTGPLTLTYFVAVIEFILFSFVFLILVFDLYKIIKNKKQAYFSSRLGLNLFSLVNIVFPTLTGTFSSIPRYALLSLAFFIVLPDLKSTFLKISIAIIFTILHILMLAFFSQGFFVS